MKFKVGIIGCGVICENHLVPLSKNKNTQVVAVCDIVKDRADKIADKYNCKAYYNYMDMINNERLDSVHICLPHHLHSEVSVYALNNGLDVLCEKPMDISLTRALKMKDAADKSKRKLGIVFQNQYTAGATLIKSRLNGGKLGKIIGASAQLMWYRDQKYYDHDDWRGKWNTEGGGVTINQAVHTLDLLMSFVDSEVDSVNVSLSHKGETTIEVEDTSEGVIKFKNGLNAIFYFSTNFIGFQHSRIFLNCEKGIAELLGSDAIIRYNDGVVEKTDSDRQIKLISKECYGSGHYALINEFYNDSGKSNAKDMLYRALKTQELLEMIYNSK